MKYSLKLLSEECFGLGNFACNETLSGDGRIFVPYGSADGSHALLSSDNGLTWEKTDLPAGRPTPPFIRLSDGTFIAMGFENAVYTSIFDRDAEKIPFYAAVYRAKTFDDVACGRVETDFCKVDIPRLSFGFGDSGNAFAGCCVQLLELSNGDILSMMYGQFKDDTTLCPYFEQYGGYKFYLYRVWTVVSHDRGKSWEYVSTVADVQTYPIADINAEGYCEPYCIEVYPGHLCMILRTGGHEVVSPLYCTHSYDFGKTWEAPYEICSWGVLPKVIKMADGTLALTTGHEHNVLLFSDDGGRTWSDPCMVEECYGKWGNSPSGYNTIVESRPGEITIVFDDPKALIDAPDGRKRQLYARRYAVCRGE